MQFNGIELPALENFQVVAYPDRIVGEINGNGVISLIKVDDEWVVQRIESLSGYDVLSAITMMRIYYLVFAKVLEVDPAYFQQYATRKIG